MRRGIVIGLLAVFICWVSRAAHAQPASTAVEVLTGSGLALQPQVEWEGARLIVGGPGGYWIERSYGVGEPIEIHGFDASGSPLSAGLYRYELTLFSGGERTGTHSGYFFVESGQVARRNSRGGAIGPDLDEASPSAGGPVIPKDLVEPGDIKAGGGLVTGDTTLNPLDGQLLLEFLGGVAYLTRNQSSLDFAVGFNTPLVLQDDGDVGIGTFAPNAKLHVVGGPGGNVAIVQGGALAVQRSDGISANIRFTADGQSWLFQNQPTDGSFNIRDQTASVTPVRIFPGGQGATLVVRNGRLGLRNTAPQHPIHAFNGARLTSGGVWANASSRENKQDIERLSKEEALAALEGLDPVKFAYTVDTTDRHVGFIAEDVPELVATSDRKALAAMDVVAVLTKVVQEQQAQIAEQKRQFETELAELRELLEVQRGAAEAHRSQ